MLMTSLNTNSELDWAHVVSVIKINLASGVFINEEIGRK